ncbi:hypothetical protein AQUCO_02300049v1 [Aquilegia coerulea]|uniref:Serine aminopeptidase S33 domain-containing protein n=1 Tax=Aquilegia coerulea TaxID=218851 RepID=A0A2G5DC16_AQUCA|nr:hypothetical protein AQUCO_02300049v1 [Aquilegia coerulea]
MEFPCSDCCSISELVLKAASLIPISHYLLGIWIISFICCYNFLEIHIISDFFNGFRGNPVSLTFNSSSQIYQNVVSKCSILHGRYLVTPWLASPHLQTSFLNFLGRPPKFTYKRQLFLTPDSGTIAFDWLMPSEVTRSFSHRSNAISKEDTTPIVVVIPGLMSDSDSPYIKHLAFDIARSGWNVVVSNHRGLGGVSLTSDWFYNAGWTEDVRVVVDYLHREYPKAPLFAVGTSIGANVLVKYLGEEGDNTHLAGAAAICSPWDLLVCDRFINRRLVQRFYGRAITIGLQIYARTHKSIYSRLVDWEGIQKSRSVRDFDKNATCILGKYETADTYYRNCSSAGYVKNVAVPLLCISALDDPVCTREAIPWDECRANKNIVLATTPHGGHLAFFEGITAHCLWWVRAVDEFFGILHSTPFMHKRKERPDISAEPLIDQGPYISLRADGMVSAMVDEGTSNDMLGILPQEQQIHDKEIEDIITDPVQEAEPDTEPNTKSVCDNVQLSEHDTDSKQDANDAAILVRRHLKELSRHSRRSMWLLAYIAVITTWPFLGSALLMVFKRKVRNVIPSTWLRK